MKLAKGIALFRENLKSLDFVPALLTRLTIATVFVGSGWGKLTHLERTIDFFQSLGVPLASVQAPLAGATEWICGVLILLGLATRLAVLPLLLIMALAIRVARWEDVDGIRSLPEITEFLYFVLLSWLVVCGAGRLSLDHWIGKSGFRRKTKNRSGSRA